MKCIPDQYKDQIQTGLALSGEKVNKGLFVDAYFRTCSLKQLEPSLKHNPHINGVGAYPTKNTATLAWDICYLFSKQKISPNQTEITDLGAIVSRKKFESIMQSIAEKNIWCSYGPVRMSFRKQDEDEEFLRFNRMKKSFSESSEAPKPVG